MIPHQQPKLDFILGELEADRQPMTSLSLMRTRRYCIVVGYLLQQINKVFLLRFVEITLKG